MPAEDGDDNMDEDEVVVQQTQDDDLRCPITKMGLVKPVKK